MFLPGALSSGRPDDHLSSADRACRVLPQPDVNAVPVEHVHAPGQPPRHLPVDHHGQAHRAFCRLLVLVDAAVLPVHKLGQRCDGVRVQPRRPLLGHSRGRIGGRSRGLLLLLARGAVYEVPPDHTQDEQYGEEGAKADAQNDDVGGGRAAGSRGGSGTTRGIGWARGERKAGLVRGEATAGSGLLACVGGHGAAGGCGQGRRRR